jgi:hypothetical protein
MKLSYAGQRVQAVFHKTGVTPPTRGPENQQAAIAGMRRDRNVRVAVLGFAFVDVGAATHDSEIAKVGHQTPTAIDV